MSREWSLDRWSLTIIYVPASLTFIQDNPSCYLNWQSTLWFSDSYCRNWVWWSTTGRRRYARIMARCGANNLDRRGPTRWIISCKDQNSVSPHARRPYRRGLPAWEKMYRVKLRGWRCGRVPADFHDMVSPSSLHRQAVAEGRTLFAELQVRLDTPSRQEIVAPSLVDSYDVDFRVKRLGAFVGSRQEDLKERFFFWMNVNARCVYSDIFIRFRVSLTTKLETLQVLDPYCNIIWWDHIRSYCDRYATDMEQLAYALITAESMACKLAMSWREFVSEWCLDAPIQALIKEGTRPTLLNVLWIRFIYKARGLKLTKEILMANIVPVND